MWRRSVTDTPAVRVSARRSGTVGYAVTVHRDRDSLRRRHSESQTPLWVAGPGPALPAGGTAGPPPMPALVARRLVSSQLPRLATGRVAVTNGYPHSMFATVTLGYRSGLRVSHGHRDRRRPGSGRPGPSRAGRATAACVQQITDWEYRRPGRRPRPTEAGLQLESEPDLEPPEARTHCCAQAQAPITI